MTTIAIIGLALVGSVVYVLGFVRTQRMFFWKFRAKEMDYQYKLWHNSWQSEEAILAKALENYERNWKNGHIFDSACLALLWPVVRPFLAAWRHLSEALGNPEHLSEAEKRIEAQRLHQRTAELEAEVQRLKETQGF